MTSIKEKFIGKWKLESVIVKHGDSVIYPFGKDIKGLLFYDNEHMSVQIMMPNAVPVQQTLSESKNLNLKDMAWCLKNLGYMGYFGKYDIDEVNKQIIHHVDASISQNIVGGDEIRNYLFNDDGMVLSTGPMELKWTKIG